MAGEARRLRILLRVSGKTWMPTPAFAWGRLFVGMTIRRGRERVVGGWGEGQRRRTSPPPTLPPPTQAEGEMVAGLGYEPSACLVVGSVCRAGRRRGRSDDRFGGGRRAADRVAGRDHGGVDQQVVDIGSGRAIGA